MKAYLDSAYVAKFYLTEPDAARVRRTFAKAQALYSSAWCLAEVACAVHRHVREGRLTPAAASGVLDLFLDHVDRTGWLLIPVSEQVLRDVAAGMKSVPPDVVLRAGDAVHLVSAKSAGFSEIWSSDRHLLLAASLFGLRGRSV